MLDLQSRGVRFTGPVENHGYGLVTYFEAPGGVRVQLYQPRYRKKSPDEAGEKASTPGAEADVGGRLGER